MGEQFRAYDVWFECDYPHLSMAYECEAESPEHAAEVFAHDHDGDARNRGETCSGDGVCLVVVVAPRDQSLAGPYTFEVTGRMKPVYVIEEKDERDG